MGIHHLETCNGLEVMVTVCEAESGSWHSQAEVDLGKTGHVVFQDSEKTYASADEAKLGAMALATENLNRSRIGRANT